MKSPEKAASEPADLPHVILSRKRRWVVTAGILLGMFLAALEATVVGTAMPTVIASLGGLDRYSWVLSAYLLASTVTVPIWGRLSDLYGRRPLYLIGVALFIIGSVLSGASRSITHLIIFRAVQGLGAGESYSASLTINGDIFTPAERARIQGLFSGVWGLASILGPLAGGIITDQFSWRWVFYINIPFGLAAAVVVGVALKEPKREGRPIIDYAGAAWMTLSVTLLLFALVEVGSAPSWISAVVLLPTLGALVFGYLFIRAEKIAPEPIIPLSIFRNRVVSAGSITSFLVGMAMFGALTFIPLFVQGSLGGTATEAGSVLTPLLLGWISLAIVGGRLMLRIGYRPTVLAGLTVLMIAFAILSQFGAGTPRWLLLFDMALIGSGMGLVVLALLIAVQNSVERNHLGIATSLNQFSRSIGGAIGVAVMGAVMTLSLNSRLSEIQQASGLPEELVASVVHNPNALIEPASRAEMPPALLKPMQNALAASLHNVFICGAVAAGLALVSGFWLPRQRLGSRPQVATSPAECEELLMAEMTTLDPEHEPVGVKGD